MVKPQPGNACEPRYASKRSPDRLSFGPQIAAAADELGRPLMPWQRLVADVGGELTEDGVPAYREVVVGVPRQNGKTMLILSWEVQRATGWADGLGEPQAVTYSAQTGLDARLKLLDDQVPLLERARRTLGISRVFRAAGLESVLWRNGSRLRLLASNEESGHGKTIDLGVKDELFADKDFRRDQALIPAMATRPHGQLLTCSTAGTPDSVAWNAKVELGRLAADAGKTNGLAYFEWSAELDADPADPATWWACMPALGRTIGIAAVEHAYQSMPIGEFRRAWLNIPTAVIDAVIPGVAWDLVNSQNVEAVAAVFGLDVNPERSAACLVAAGAGPVLEVVDYKAGTGWIVDRCKELDRKYSAPFVVDSTGPAAGFADELEREGLTVTRLSARDVANASGRFYDRVVEGTVQVRRHTDLDKAVAGASKRLSGDAWAWGRKTSTADISPLVAATVALSQVDSGEPEATFFTI